MLFLWKETLSLTLQYHSSFPTCSSDCCRQRNLEGKSLSHTNTTKEQVDTTTLTGFKLVCDNRNSTTFDKNEVGSYSTLQVNIQYGYCKAKTRAKGSVDNSNQTSITPKSTFFSPHQKKQQLN